MVEGGGQFANAGSHIGHRAPGSGDAAVGVVGAAPWRGKRGEGAFLGHASRSPEGGHSRPHAAVNATGRLSKFSLRNRQGQGGAGGAGGGGGGRGQGEPQGRQRQGVH